SADAAVKKRAEERLARLQGRLAQSQPSSDEDQMRTLRALQKLRADDENSWKNGLQDLVFVGSGAGPELRTRLLEETRDRLCLARGVQALATIGGESAAAALREIVEKGEAFTRKAALAGMRAAAEPTSLASPPVRRAIRAFFAVPERELRVTAMSML